MNRFFAQFVIVLLFILSAGGLFARDRAWIRIRSGNSEVYSQASEESARDILLYFDRLRTLFSKLTGEDGDALPIRIVVFGSKSEYSPYRIDKSADIYYSTGREYDQIVIGGSSVQVLPPIIREYARALMRESGRKMPVWIAEGIPELFSTAQVSSDHVEIGALPGNRRKEMLRGTQPPLATSLGDFQRAANEKNTGGSAGVTGEEWALLHMLALDERYRTNFSELYRRIEAGASSRDALAMVYGKPLASLEEDVRGYLQKSAFQAVSYPLEGAPTSAPGAESVSDYDAKLMLAGLMNWSGKEAEAKTRLESLVSEDPHRPEPHIVLGYLVWRGNAGSEVLGHFDRGWELGGRNPRFLWDYGRMVSVRDRVRAIDVFRALIQEDPNRVDARLELASLQLAEQQATAAIETLRPIRKVDPAKAARLFQMLAYAHLETGDRKGAESAYQRWSESASAKDKAALARFQEMLNSSDIPAANGNSALVERLGKPDGALDAGLFDGLTSVTGMFTELICGASETRFVVRTAEGSKTFAVTDVGKMRIVGQPSGKIELVCGLQNPVKVRVGFVRSNPPASDADGVLQVLSFQP